MAVRVLATLTTQPGKGGDLLARWPDLAAQVHDEEPNLEYALWRDAAAPDVFVVWELWESMDGLTAHGRSPHMREFGAAAAGFLAGPAVVQVLGEVG